MSYSQVMKFFFIPESENPNKSPLGDSGFLDEEAEERKKNTSLDTNEGDEPQIVSPIVIGSDDCSEANTNHEIVIIDDINLGFTEEEILLSAETQTSGLNDFDSSKNDAAGNTSSSSVTVERLLEVPVTPPRRRKRTSGSNLDGSAHKLIKSTIGKTIHFFVDFLNVY